MHYLQKHIIDKIRFDGPTRYSDLLPTGTESSLLRYHLQQLERDGFVEKQSSDGKYVLTTTGMTEVDFLSIVGTHEKRTPKVITYTLLTNNGTLLLYRKDKEPYRTLIGLVGGKLHFGESAQSAAEREVYEKFGLKIVQPELQGLANIGISDSNTLQTHAIAYVFMSKISVDSEFTHSNAVWIKHHQLATQTDLMPDLLPVLQAIDNQDSKFILDLDLTI